MNKERRLITVRRNIPAAASFATGNTIQVGFSAAVKDAMDMRAGDAIKFTHKENKLVLTYLGDLSSLSRYGTAKRIRRSGSGVLLAIAEHKLPELRDYFIPTKSVGIEFEIVDGNIEIDLSPFVQEKKEVSPLHDFSKIVKRVKSFDALSDLNKG